MVINEIEKKYFIGNYSSGSWASVYAYKPKSHSIYLEKGELIAVIAVKGPEDFNAHTAGNLVLDHFHEAYFESNEISILHSLEKAVVSAAKKLGEIIDNDEKLTREGIELDLTAMSAVDGVYYFVNMGMGNIYISRGEEITNINAAMKDPTGEGYFKSATTFAKEDDILLLMTPQASENLSKNELKIMLTDFDESLITDKVIENPALTALMMVKIITDLSKVTPESEEELDVEENDNTIQDEIDVETQSPNAEVKDEIQTEIEEEYADESELIQEDQDEELVDNENEEGKVEIIGENKQTKVPLKERLSNIRSGISNSKLVTNIKSRIDKSKPADSEDSTFVHFVKQVGGRISKGAKVFKKKFWDDFLQMEQGIYLRNARKGTNWRFVIFLVIVIVIFGWLTLSVISSNVEYNRNIDKVKKAIATSEADLNDIEPKINNILTVPESYAREKTNYQTKLDSTKNQLVTVKDKNIEKEKIAALLKRESDLDTKLNRKIIVSDPKVVIDFASKVDEKSKPSDMAFYKGNLYISDEAKGKIYSIAIDGSDYKEVASDVKNVKALTLDDDGNIYVVDNDKSSPFLQISKNGGAAKRFTGIFSEGLTSIKRIEAYKLNDNIRIYFAKSTGTPIQYIGQVGSNFAGAYDRLTDTSFANTKDIKIGNGRIYILVPGLGAVRFFGDQREDVTVAGLSTNDNKNLINSSAFNVEGNYIFYGSNDGKSIYVTSKKRGEDTTISDYIAAYSYTGSGGFLSDIKSITLDTDSHSIYVLDGTRVLKFDLSELTKFSF